MKKLSTLAVAVVALNLHALDWYLINMENDGSHNSWYNAHRWRVRNSDPKIDGENGAELSPDDTYAVIWNYYVRAKARPGESYGEFVGKRLTIENGYLLHEISGSAGAEKITYFRNEGLFLQEGCWYYSGGNSDRLIVTEGTVTIVAPAEKPFKLAAKYDKNSFIMRGPLVAAKTAALQIGVGQDYNGNELVKENFSVTFAGDCTNYLGTVIVTSAVDNASSVYGCMLTLATSDFTGGLLFSPGTRLSIPDSAQRKTVGSLSLDGRGVLAMSNRMPLLVTNTFSIVNGPVPLEISLAADCVPTDLAVTNKVAILEYPAESMIEPKDFSPYAAGNDMIIASFAGLEMSEADGVRTISAVLTPVVVQTVNDTANNNYQGDTASSLYEHDSAHWSDSLNVHPLANYLVTKIGENKTTLLTPGPVKDSYVFPGESLTIGTGCQIRNFNSSMYVKRLNFCSGSYMFVGKGAGGVVTGDVVRVESGEVKFSAFNGCKMRIDSEMQGKANIWFGQIGGESNPQAFNEFTRLNTNFFGSIYVRQVLSPDLEKKFQTLYVSDERNLGGRLGMFRYNALTLEHMSQLRTRKSFSLTENMNRGVYVNGVGRFYVDEGMKMGMDAVLTMNGLLRKEGTGKLSMGGSVKYLANSVPGDAPRANSNLFEIVEGTVEVGKATALDGLETTFHAGTRLSLRVNRDDADLTERGIVNVKTDKPFSLSETFEGDKMPVAFVFAEDDAPVIGEVLALITVNASAADSVEALLPATVRTGVRGVVAEVFRREPNDDRTVTFAARIRRYGFRFVVR